MRRFIFLSLSLLTIVFEIHAEVIPRSYTGDRHVQVAAYDPSQVYRVSTMQGYITAIQFGDEEKVISVNIGDSSAWLVNVQNDIINLKPIIDRPDTNMNVLTTRGTYQFFLTAPPSKESESGLRKPFPNTIFLLRFRYSDTTASRKSGFGSLLTKKPLVENWKYTARGNTAVTPVCVYDNGRFTFFDFGDRQDIPAIFTVDHRGRESLINYHIQGKYVVVETTAKQFTLRNGDQIASIFNEMPS